MKTLQEIFDIAYLGLAKQGFERATKADGGCKYRDEMGRKCAIGQCIPDEKYYPYMENCDPSTVLRITGVIDDLEIDGLSDLQRAHDTGFVPEQMKARLASFASDYDLTIPKIEGEVQ